MIEELQLQNFRNHTDLSVKFGHQTVLVGPNGAGKTNILEAVSLLSLTTSWRAGKDSEVVSWDAPFARIVSGDKEMVIQRKPYYKRIRIDGLSKRVGEVVGTMPTVLFQPDDSQLITGSPSYRRNALDRLLAQSVPGYLTSLSRLQRVLKQRNKLLKQIQEREAQIEELAYWDEQLAAETAIIRAARSEAVPAFAATVTDKFAELISDVPPVTIQYDQSPRHAATEETILHHLQENHYKEIGAGVTLYGPQREDITFMWGEHPAAEGMSRGQIRALVLAFKLAEVCHVEVSTGASPILLLDDVYSEFDQERRKAVTKLTEEYQSILTTTDVEKGYKGEVIEL
ncbi:MAG TPA: DNA replication/repair protein RecF [Verrucomicrobiae bacterium]|nr:DNA replication/repair protein RecF [Verrucomicrobiae bacterium]